MDNHRLLRVHFAIQWHKIRLGQSITVLIHRIGDVYVHIPTVWDEIVDYTGFTHSPSYGFRFKSFKPAKTVDCSWWRMFSSSLYRLEKGEVFGVMVEPSRAFRPDFVRSDRSIHRQPEISDTPQGLVYGFRVKSVKEFNMWELKEKKKELKNQL